MLIDFEDKDLETTVQRDNVCFVTFSAMAWCKPCVNLHPVMQKLSDEYKDKAKFYHADIDSKAINFSTSANVRGVPTTVCFSSGQEVSRLVGGVPEQKMKSFIEESLTKI